MEGSERGGREIASVVNYQALYTKILKIIISGNIYNFQHWHYLHFADKATEALRH